ncbi:MAG: hypothetical protein PHD76_12125 [Methylacidiphilales bacterium]|nr:hypothetical protein [Candidatus Methylacidiphilales bacterium]
MDAYQVVATLILIALLWFQLWKHDGVLSGLPLSFRIQNGLVTTVLVAGYAATLPSIAWALTHSDTILSKLWVRVGMFDPIIATIMWIFTQIAGVMALSMSFMVAQRKKGMNKVMGKLIPYFTFFAWFNFLIGYQKSSGNDGVGCFAIIFAGSMLLFGVVTFWVRKFYCSDKADQFFDQRLGPDLNSI